MIIKKVNPVISLFRVISMAFVILAHLSTYLNYGILTQILNVGVFSFLLISGYLYSNKSIDNSIKWLHSRFMKICIPLYIYIIFIIFSGVLLKEGTFKIKYVFVYFLNLQGTGFIIHNLNLNLLPGTGHLWFLTVLMFCYFLTIIMKKLEKNHLKSKSSFLILLSAAFLIHCITSFFGIILNYFIIYFIGYFLGKYCKNISKKNYLLFTLVMLLAMALRLGSRHYLDNTVIYSEIIVMATHNILSIWMFLSLYFLHEKYPVIIEETAKLKVVIFFDNLSYYIYLTHYVFLTGYFSVCFITSNKIIGIGLFIVFSLVSSMLLCAGCAGFKLLGTRRDSHQVADNSK